MTLKADVFFNLLFRKTWQNKCLKSPVSEEPLTSDKGNVRKDCPKLNDRTFTIFIDNC